jgi:hypothetical protein
VTVNSAKEKDVPMTKIAINEAIDEVNMETPYSFFKISTEARKNTG